MVGPGLAIDTGGAMREDRSAISRIGLPSKHNSQSTSRLGSPHRPDFGAVRRGQVMVHTLRLCSPNRKEDNTMTCLVGPYNGFLSHPASRRHVPMAWKMCHKTGFPTPVAVTHSC